MFKNCVTDLLFTVTKMNSFLFFLLISVIYAERINNVTAEVVYDSRGGVYLSYGQDVYGIINYKDFKLSAGYSKVTFDIEDQDIMLLNYYPLPEPKEELSTGLYSPMFNQTLRIAILRGSKRNNSVPLCLSVERVKSYVKYVELGMRLWTANQIRIYQGKDLYISECLVINEAIYQEASHAKIRSALLTEASKTKPVPDVGVRWFITDTFTAPWSGLAVVGGPGAVSNPKKNYWLISKGGIGNDDDKNNGRVLVIIHEYGHSCGFGHSGSREIVDTGVFYDFTTVDNYFDCASYMSNCNSWKFPPASTQYRHITVQNKPEPWQFKDVEEGVHKYRIYAFDHPYSRYYLGVSEQYHNDSEIIDGIAFKYNCLSIRILINTNFTSKYTGNEGTTGYLALEYRHNQAGKSAKDFGIRILSGSGSKSNLLDANYDRIGTWSDSSILPGIDYYPYDFDTGTLRIRVTKIHKANLKESLEEEIVKEDKRNYDEASYAEVEIECYPNKKPPTLSPPNGLPKLKFSPSFYNCKTNDDGSGYTCSRSTTTSGWYYFINENNRNKNIPRMYTTNNQFIKGRKSIRSYNGNDLSNSKLCYGDNGNKCITITVNAETFTNIGRRNFQFASVNRTKINDVNKTVEELGNVNLIYGNGLKVPEGGKAYISDLFGNEKEIKVVDKIFAELLPPLETDGFAEGAVVVKDKDGKVTYYNGFTLYHSENENRVSIELNDNNEIILSPAVIPDGKYTTTTMLYSVIIKANNWFNYPILNLEENDYVLIDFKGIIAYDLKMTIENDLNEYSIDLSALGGLNNTSYKLTFEEMNNKTGGWSEIDRIKFNKDVEIQNIRPIYSKKVGNQIVSISATTSNFNYDGYKYTIKAPKSENKYIYKKVNVEIYGKEYSFDSSTKTIKLKRPNRSDDSNNSDGKGLSGGEIAGIIIGVVGVLIISLVCGVIIFRKMKIKRAKVDVSV